LEALEPGFWIDKMLAQCRTGETIAMPPGGSAAYMNGDGFFWYGTSFLDHFVRTSA